MKLSSTLLQAITLGITVSAVTAGCHRDDVKSGSTKQEKVQPSKTGDKPVGAHDSCPACGMG